MDTSIIAALTALAAVLLGPLVSLSVGEKQTRANVRSVNRQAWINSLRDALAEFISVSRVVMLATEFEDRYKRAEKMIFLESKIKLLLNPHENDHQNLNRAISDARVSAIGFFAAGKDEAKKDEAKGKLLDSLDKVVDLARPILKREWERVKQVS